MATPTRSCALQALSAIPVFGIFAQYGAENTLCQAEGVLTSFIRTASQSISSIGVTNIAALASGAVIPDQQAAALADTSHQTAMEMVSSKKELANLVALRVRIKTISTVSQLLTCIAIIVLLFTVLRNSPLNIKIAAGIVGGVLLPFAIYNGYNAYKLQNALKEWNRLQEPPLAFSAY